jgi:MerR family copper efflux transcriptional regulator
MLVGALARRTAVSKDAIRLYERTGLITSTPIPASSREYRDYAKNAVEAIEKIKIAKSAGLHLSEIRFLFDAWNTKSSEQRHEILVQRIALIDQQIARLQK